MRKFLKLAAALLLTLLLAACSTAAGGRVMDPELGQPRRVNRTEHVQRAVGAVRRLFSWGEKMFQRV